MSSESKKSSSRKRSRSDKKTKSGKKPIITIKDIETKARTPCSSDGIIFPSMGVRIFNKPMLNALMIALSQKYVTYTVISIDGKDVEDYIEYCYENIDLLKNDNKVLVIMEKIDGTDMYNRIKPHVDECIKILYGKSEKTEKVKKAQDIESYHNINFILNMFLKNVVNMNKHEYIHGDYSLPNVMISGLKSTVIDNEYSFNEEILCNIFSRVSNEYTKKMIITRLFGSTSTFNNGEYDISLLQMISEVLTYKNIGYVSTISTEKYCKIMCELGKFRDIWRTVNSIYYIYKYVLKIESLNDFAKYTNKIYLKECICKQNIFIYNTMKTALNKFLVKACINETFIEILEYLTGLDLKKYDNDEDIETNNFFDVHEIFQPLIISVDRKLLDVNYTCDVDYISEYYSTIPT